MRTTLSKQGRQRSVLDDQIHLIRLDVSGHDKVVPKVIVAREVRKISHLRINRQYISSLGHLLCCYLMLPEFL